MPDRLGLAEDPERLPRGRIDRHHLPPRRGHRVEDAVHVDRGGPVEVVEVGSEVVAAPDPGHLQVGEVAAVDLLEGGRAGVAGVAAEVAPLPVLGPRQALRRGGASQQQHGGAGRNEARRARCEAFRHDVVHSLAGLCSCVSRDSPSSYRVREPGVQEGRHSRPPRWPAAPSIPLVTPAPFGRQLRDGVKVGAGRQSGLMPTAHRSRARGLR